ncbi:Clp protease N-terminal domain-containing protein [Streptomyces sp. 12297]|uniref:Clp protease N-terminal domain-containing protein n=1 Tax=Streptomyces sp. NBC_00239 TaxID=2903640 RepID=UPI002E28C422|nr:Clp protease N-terminal domain-containing protein [Streptomyces sp. NBC_00239]
MFERFTTTARDAVKGAVDQARLAGADTVDEQHLLLSLLNLGTLSPLGVDPVRLTADLAAARRRGGLSKADQEALAGIGIDLAQIVSRIEETHGEGALAPARGSRRRRWTNHRPFTPGAKKILEQSLRIALGRGDRHIGTEHLLLALISRPSPVAETLADHAVTYATAEAALPHRPAA